MELFCLGIKILKPAVNRVLCVLQITEKHILLFTNPFNKFFTICQLKKLQLQFVNDSRGFVS